MRPSTFSGSTAHTHPTKAYTNDESIEAVRDGRTQTEHNDHDDLISSLEGGRGSDGGGGGASDLRPGIYEGGFKTWECGVDLASYLASCLPSHTNGDVDRAKHIDKDRNWGDIILRLMHRLNNSRNGDGPEQEEEENEDLDIVELGAGSAMPSLVLLRRLTDLSRKQQGPTRAGLAPHTEKDENKVEGEKGPRTKRRQARIRFILCDYNVEVLRLLTTANILLQLVASPPPPPTNNNSNGDTGDERTDPPPEKRHQDQDQDKHNYDTSTWPKNRDEDENEGELELESENTLNHHILSTLESASISIDFISGAWGPSFVDLLTTTMTITDISASAVAGEDEATAAAEEKDSPPRCTTHTTHTTRTTQRKRNPGPLLILACETIYSPDTIAPFTETLMALLKSRSTKKKKRRRQAQPQRQPQAGSGSELGSGSGSGSTTALALVAAKKMYFGVGGGVDGFVVEVRRRGGTVDVVADDIGKGEGGGGGGVGRVIMAVTVAAAEEEEEEEEDLLDE